MHDPRTSPALRTLAHLTGDPPPARWSWSVRRLDSAGRLCLTRSALAVLGPGPWRARWHHLALLVETDTSGQGPRATVDDRGRLTVPIWLRQRGRDVLVGLDHDQPGLLVAPAEVLDRLGDVLAGRSR